ncbi:MAG: transcription antitermination protein NusB [Enhygromyxa sp.]
MSASDQKDPKKGPPGASEASGGATGSRPSNRARGRELGLWILCHLESHPARKREALELFWRELPAIEVGDEFIGAGAEELAGVLADASARRLARRLVEAYLDHADAIDEQIEAASARWRLARMDQVDRNLLRLAAVELAHRFNGQGTPRNVVVAEAVRLAARYGSERSIAFVNALAEALAQKLRDTKQRDTPPADAEADAADDDDDGEGGAA